MALWDEEKLRIALRNALDKFTTEVISTEKDKQFQVQIHRLALKLINYILLELKINKQAYITKMKSEMNGKTR